MTVNQNYLIPVATIILLLALSPANAARQDTVQAIIPWEGEGQVYHVDSNAVLFLGALKGVMYVETSTGDLHEAFVVCPVMQEINTDSGATQARGRCEVVVSPVDVLYAEITCEGKKVGECAGKFTLKSGEGKFAGISGSGNLRIRSPMHALVADMTSGALLRVAAGLAVINDLKFSIP
jgi:hypothetical protein